MDMMLEEELIDLMTFCLQNPDSTEINDKHSRITEILENFSFVLKNRITQEIEKDPSPLLSLWHGLSSDWPT